MVARVLIVEDHDVMRFGLVTVLNREPDLRVTGEARDGHSALAQIRSHHFDVALVDLTLPDCEGVQLIKLIRAHQPELPILVSTMHDEMWYGERVVSAGARGYVMKSEATSVLVEAIRKVAAGGTFISEQLLNRTANVVREDSGGYSASPAAALSDREMEVLRLLGQGCSSAAVAERLHRSIKTIDAHRENIKKKLGLRNANELLRYAVCWVEEETRGHAAHALLEDAVGEFDDGLEIDLEEAAGPAGTANRHLRQLSSR